MRREANTLENKTLKCPCHNKPLLFEQVCGIRVFRDGFCRAKCPVKGTAFYIKGSKKDGTI